MKTFSIHLLLLFFGSLPLSVMAQLDQGQSFVSGSLTLNSDQYHNSQFDKTSSNQGFGVVLRGGHLIKKNLALTLGFNFGRSKSTGYNQIFTPAATSPTGQQLYLLQFADTQNSSNLLGFSMGLSRFVALKEKLYLSLDGNLTLNFNAGSNTEQIPGQNALVSDWKQRDYSFNFNPGLIYFLSPRFGLSGTFGGFFLRFQPKSASSQSNSWSGGFTSNGVLGIGLNYFIK